METLVWILAIVNLILAIIFISKTRNNSAFYFSTNENINKFENELLILLFPVLCFIIAICVHFQVYWAFKIIPSSTSHETIVFLGCVANLFFCLIVVFFLNKLQKHK